MNGILLIDKPKGWTSFDVVNKVRWLVQASELATSNKKRFPVGHTGTLDPLATGLLVLLLGDYTKRAPELTKLDKTYEVTMKLGETSTTGDAEGIITPTESHQKMHIHEKVGLPEVKEVIKKFVGEIEQTPPIYSAIKVNGQRAYRLARAGKEVTLEPRKAIIYSIEDIEYAYPEVKFMTKVSSGTYIRSLVEDIGKELSTGAYMSNLRRTRVGQWDIKDTVPMDSLTAERVIEALETMN